MTPTTTTCDSSRGRKRHEDCGSDWSHWVFTCLDCGVTETFASWERMKLFGCRHYGWPTEKAEAAVARLEQRLEPRCRCS